MDPGDREERQLERIEIDEARKLLRACLASVLARVNSIDPDAMLAKIASYAVYTGLGQTDRVYRYDLLPERSSIEETVVEAVMHEVDEACYAGAKKREFDRMLAELEEGDAEG